jgi:hypothetical protein
VAGSSEGYYVKSIGLPKSSPARGRLG